MTRPGGLVRRYGSGPLHLVAVLTGLALAAYVVGVLGPGALWSSGAWWQSIAVWFVGAVLLQDLVLLPLAALADRLLDRALGSAERRRGVPLRNHVRVPALGAALLFGLFLPGIVRQGAASYHAATGQTQDRFLGRWLLLVVGLFAASAVVYAVRVLRARIRAGRPPRGVSKADAAARTQPPGI